MCSNRPAKQGNSVPVMSVIAVVIAAMFMKSERKPVFNHVAVEKLSGHLPPPLQQAHLQAHPPQLCVGLWVSQAAACKRSDSCACWVPVLCMHPLAPACVYATSKSVALRLCLPATAGIIFVRYRLRRVSCIHRYTFRWAADLQAHHAWMAL